MSIRVHYAGEQPGKGVCSCCEQSPERCVYMDKGTVLDCVEVYPDGVSDHTQSLVLSDCDSSAESGTLEARIAGLYIYLAVL